jgi:hypothetical protein
VAAAAFGCTAAVRGVSVTRDDVRAPPDEETELFGMFDIKSVPALVRSLVLRCSEPPKSLSDF